MAAVDPVADLRPFGGAFVPESFSVPQFGLLFDVRFLPDVWPDQELRFASMVLRYLKGNCKRSVNECCQVVPTAFASRRPC